MKRSRLPIRPRPLVLEDLESRSMLAAVATAVGGIINIVGDNLANDVRVHAGAVPGQFVVTGVTGAPKTFNNITGISADLKGGNDFFKVGTSGEPAEVLGNITVLLGPGSDQANIRVNSLGIVTIDGGLQVNALAQDDVVDVNNSILGGLVVNLWGGNDDLFISNSAILTLVANLGVNSLLPGQTDSDEVILESSAIGNAVITLGTADNGNINLVDIRSTVFGALTITGGNKADEIFLGSPEECGIGAQLRFGLVDLVDDLEPLLAQFKAKFNTELLLNKLDSLLGTVAGALQIDLEGFDLSQLWAGGVDPSDALNALFARLEEEGLNFCEIGQRSTVVTNVVINTLAGNDFVQFGEQELLLAAALPDVEELVDKALSADVLILGSATIITGDGHDCVELNHVFVGVALTVLLGSGNDCLCVNDVTVAIAIFDGGAGFDELLFDFDGVRDELTGYLSYTQTGFEFIGACFVNED